MRIIFMGTPEIAVPSLTELVARGHEVVCVYTQPPRPAGRGKAERKSPVHLCAEGFGLPVRTPKNFREEADRQAFADFKADVAVVVAYGLLLPKPILEAPGHGCLNLHASLLPRWRGAAPIQRAIEAGDTQTGVCVMQMDEGLDTGPVALVEDIPINDATTAGDLHDEMARRGADLMARALAALERGTLEFTPQPEEGASYARKIDKAEARVDFVLPSEQVLRKIHGFSPFPGAWAMLEIAGDPVRVKFLRVELADGSGEPGTILDDSLTIACAEGAIRPVLVQREGKAAMGREDFLRGAGGLAGSSFA